MHCIIGVSSDQEEALLGKTAHRAGVSRIGRWLEEGVVAGIIIIYRKDGKTFLERNLKDGSSMREEVVERPSPGGRRFEIREPSSDDGAYYFIDKSGNLQLRDIQTGSLLSKTGTTLATRAANGGFACPELEF